MLLCCLMSPLDASLGRHRAPTNAIATPQAIRFSGLRWAPDGLLQESIPAMSSMCITWECRKRSLMFCTKLSTGCAQLLICWIESWTFEVNCWDTWIHLSHGLPTERAVEIMWFCYWELLVISAIRLALFVIALELIDRHYLHVLHGTSTNFHDPHDAHLSGSNSTESFWISPYPALSNSWTKSWNRINARYFSASSPWVFMRHTTIGSSSGTAALFSTCFNHAKGWKSVLALTSMSNGTLCMSFPEPLPTLALLHHCER